MTLYPFSMSTAEERREALIKAAQLARVKPGEDYDTATCAADEAAEHLLDFMHRRGEFALGLLQASSYMLSGTRRDEYEVREQVNYMTDKAIRSAPGNPDILRRAYTIFTRLTPDAASSEADVILTDANWENLPKRDLLE
jgi:hypothetical protein